MSVSTAQSTGGDNAHGSQLRRELAHVRAENKYLRRRILALTSSRDHWRAEAQSWKWAALK